MAINGLGNVGIGTTSPGSTLVIGGPDPEIRLTTGGGEIPLTIRADNDMASDPINPYIKTGGGGSLDIESSNQSGQYGKLFLNYTKTGHIMMVGGGGNVGIGITGTGANPGATLDVFASTSSANALKVRSGTTGDVYGLYVSTTGNVGIGTADPKSKLQVVGLTEYTDNAAAAAAGLTVGAFYRTGDLLKVVH